MNNRNNALEFDAVINNTDFKRQIDEMNARLRTLVTTTERETNKMDDSFKKLAIGVGAAFTLDRAKAFVSDIIRVRGEFQKYEAVLTNSLGSSEKAAAAMGMLADYAKTSPFQFNELTGAFVKLANQGFTPTIDQLTKLGDIAASTGKSFDQLTEAIIDAQVGEFERLKEFGIRASKEGDNVTFAFKGVETQVAFTSDTIRDYIVGLGELNGVTGSTAAISKTLEGQVSNLEDAWTNMINELGQKSEGVLSGGIEAAALLVENYQEILKVLGVVIAAYGTYKAAVIAVATAQKLSLLATQTVEYIKMANALGFATANQIAFNKAQLMNPYAAALAAIVALTTAIYLYGSAASATEKIQNELKKKTDSVAVSIAEERGKIQDLLSVAKNEKLSKEQRLDAIKKLNAISPQYLGSINLETLNTKQATEAIELYIQALNRKLQAQAFADQKIENYRRLEELRQEKAEFDASKKKGGFATGWFTLTHGAKSLGTSMDMDEYYRKEIEAREKQNKALDDQTKKMYEEQAETERAGGEKVVAVTKETFVKQLAATKAKKDALDVDSKDFKSQAAAFNKEIGELQKKIAAYDDPKAPSKGVSEKIFPKGSIAEFDRQINHVQDKLNEIANPKSQPELVAKLNAQLAGLEKSRAEALKQIEIKSWQETLEEKKRLYQQFEQATSSENAEGFTPVDDEMAKQAKQFYADLLAGGQSYVEFLENQLIPLREKLFSGTLNMDEFNQLSNLETELHVALGDSTPIQQLQKFMEGAKESSGSLADYIDVLNGRLAELEGQTSSTALQMKSLLEAERDNITKEVSANFKAFLSEVETYEKKKLAVKSGEVDPSVLI